MSTDTILLLTPDVSFFAARQGDRGADMGAVRRVAGGPDAGGVPFEQRL